MANHVVYERHFLNHPGYHSNAFVQAYIGEREDDEDYWPSGLIIADCDRKVTLSIDLESLDDIANTLHKIDTLQGALKELRKGVIEVRRTVRQRGR